MKNISIKMGLLSLSALLLVSCAAPEENLEPFAEESIEHEKVDNTIRYEITVKDQKPAPALKAEEIPTATLENTPAPALPAPQAYPEMLKGVDDVDPWLANYVGSYGVLPTRFAKEGPFLYSLDVHPHTSRHLAGAVQDTHDE